MDGFSDKVQIELVINGRKFPFDQVNILETLHMSCSTKVSTPMMFMKLIDSAHWLSKTQDLLDGTPISITYIVQGIKKVRNFRLHSFKESLAPSGIAYSIDGYLDTVPYWLKSVSQPVIGSSDFILQSIANDCRINYKGTKTSDSMTWFPINKKYHEFAGEVAAHGFVNEQSCMQLAYDLDDVLIYANLAEDKAIKGFFLTAKYDENTYTVTDFQPKSKTGLMNAVSGYAEEMREQSILTITPDITNKAKVKSLTSRLMLNKNIHKTVDQQGQVYFRPIDAGNTHENYWSAYYQNKRLANMYGFGLDLVIAQPSEGVQLLDVINYEARLQDGQVTAYSGKYVVTARVIFIHGNNYFEKFEVCRQGINAVVESQI